jgi:pre-mRNA-processing factor 19
MFFCAISGEPLQDAVFSPKSGQLYERRLILKYVTENGKDPVSGEKLDESDLVSVKASEWCKFLLSNCMDWKLVLED